MEDGNRIRKIKIKQKRKQKEKYLLKKYIIIIYYNNEFR
jgi:hypothetical protein